MRDPDRAWEYGSREIEHEANADAYESYVTCEECGVQVDEHHHWRYDRYFRVDGASGWVPVYMCDDCYERSEPDEALSSDVQSHG